MKRIDWNASLKTKIMLVILLLVCLQNAYILYDGYRQTYQRLQAQAYRDFELRLKQLQNSLEYLAAINDYLQLQEELTALAADPELKLALLTNRKDRVMASIRRAEQGRTLEELLNDYRHIRLDATKLPALFARARNTLEGRVHLDQAQHSLLGIYPVILGTSAGKLRPDRIGVLLMWRDLEKIQGTVWSSLLQQSLGAIVVILLGALGIGWLLGRWLIRPVQELNAAASRLADGDWDYHLPEGNRDELGQLAEAFRKMAGELKNSFETLEQRVAERTAELSDANDKIMELNNRLVSLNVELEQENLRMGTELEITRRLQQMVLPREEELEDIADLDIACYMEPANEVGGDYYDVIQHEGRVKIGIGDVTGHGLESGVLMLMVQTAVRTLLLNRVQDPRIFLNVLNRIIYENTRRMASDKNLTLSLLDYREGKLCLAGQHEEVLLMRGNGEAELIDTIDLGFMLGIEADITNFIDYQEFELQPGDGIVLYTDGITEARNAERRMYGLERLSKIVKDNWQSTAGEIRDEVVNDLRKHIGKEKVLDDLTLLVIKQLPPGVGRKPSLKTMPRQVTH